MTYKLPDIFDANADKVEVVVEGLKDGMKYNKDTNSIIISQGHVGEYKLTFILKDARNKTSSHEFTFNAIEQPVLISLPENTEDDPIEFEPISSQPEETFDPEFNFTHPEKMICTAKIVKVTPMSEIYVEFNTNMKTEFYNKMKKEFNISIINKTIVDIYIVPNKERMLSENINISLLNLTWVT